MPEREAMAKWGTRLRWRLSGAWQWPAFTVLTVVDAVLLTALPFSGGRGRLVGSLLASGLINLMLIAVLGRAGGALLRRRRRHLPREIAADQAGVAAMLAFAALLTAGGLAHRPALHRSDDRRAVAVELSRRVAARSAGAQYLANLHRENVYSPGGGVYRTCFAGRDPRRDFCVYVSFDAAGTPSAARDTDQRPNAAIAGKLNPGRRAQ
jgi:hypothetical protein